MKIEFKIDDVDLEEVKYNGQFKDMKSIEELLESEPRRVIINFKNGDKIIILGSKAKEYFKKIEDIRRD